MKDVGTCLWFHRDAEVAAEYYAEVFDDCTILSTHSAASDTDAPGIVAGGVLVVELALGGHHISLLNGGEVFTQTFAASIEVRCDDSAEADRYRDRLIGDGGEESWCGWLSDRYGVAWQIYPARLGELVTDPDPVRASRAMWAMRTMRRIDIDEIERAMDDPNTKPPAA